MKQKTHNIFNRKQNEVFQCALMSHQLGEIDDAEIQYKKLLKILPLNALLLTNLGNIALQKGKIEEGLQLLKRSIKIAPNQPISHYNCGNALRDLGRYEESILSYDKAIKMKSNYVDAFYNRGKVQKNLGQFNEALQSLNCAIAINKNYIGAFWDKALILLLIGNYEEGWELYEYRWKLATFIHSSFLYHYSKPLWLGRESLENKTLMIFSEQGLGDYLQFVRYVKSIKELGAKVILETPASLLPLIKDSIDGVELVSIGDNSKNYDYCCNIMSLPLAFKTSVDNIPAQIPYIKVNDKKEINWKRKLGEKIKLRIGIAWSGSSAHVNDINRSIKIEKLAPLFELPIEIHCLQKEIRLEDNAFLKTNKNIKTYQNDLHDFSDTALLIKEMDLVISVDTAIAHLAGALGAEVWVLLPFVPDFRWMIDREDSPWYPTAKLFRQQMIGEWNSVVHDVIKCIDTYRYNPVLF